MPLSRKIAAPHRMAWIWEPLEVQPTFALRTFFGSKAVYLHELLLAAFVIKQEPWRGMLVCTTRAHHASLQAEFPALRPHSILGKWLYLPERSAHFEEVATRLMRLALQRDERRGVRPTPKTKRAR